jgi:hypothetical protein
MITGRARQGRAPATGRARTLRLFNTPLHELDEVIRGEKTVASDGELAIKKSGRKVQALTKENAGDV